MSWLRRVFFDAEPQRPQSRRGPLTPMQAPVINFNV